MAIVYVPTRCRKKLACGVTLLCGSIPLNQNKAESALLLIEKIARNDSDDAERMVSLGDLLKLCATVDHESGVTLDQLIEDDMISAGEVMSIANSYISAERWDADIESSEVSFDVAPLGIGKRSRRIVQLIDELGEGNSEDRVIELFCEAFKAEEGVIRPLYDGGAISVQTLAQTIAALSPSHATKISEEATKKNKSTS